MHEHAGQREGSAPEDGGGDEGGAVVEGACHQVAPDKLESGPFRERPDADPRYLTVPFASDRVAVSLRLGPVTAS